MTNYHLLISRSKEKIKEDELKDYIEEVTLQVQKDVLDARRTVKRAENNLATAKASYPFSINDVLEASLELQSAKEILSIVEATYDELFIQEAKAKK